MRLRLDPSFLLSSLRCALFAVAGASALAAAQNTGDPQPDRQAQGSQDQDTERIRRDQAEILRKAERLRDVMTRLLTRYEQEGRVEQAKLLKGGLEHLQSSNLVEDVAGIRNDLDSEAFARAIERQSEVVADLERLLNILLDRRSLDSLEKEIATAERLAAEANQLLARQQELRQQSQDVARGGATAAEDALAERLRDLATRQRAEAQNTLQKAGPRLPFLEDALARVRQLLERQTRLETAAEEQGKSGEADPRRARSFTLGDLGERARELIDERRRQNEWDRAQALANDLEKAAAGDDAQARDRAQQRLQDVLERLARSPRGEDAAATRAAADDLAKAMNHDQGAEALQQAAARARDLAAERAKAQRAKADTMTDALRAELGKTAEDLAAGASTRPSSASALDEAKQQLEAAQKADAAGKADEAQSALARAARTVSEARQKFDAAHPDASKLASEMAAESAQAARGLRGAPQSEQAEADAATQLEKAEQAQRAAAEGLEQNQGAQAAPAKAPVAESRQALAQAKQILEQAIASEQGGREESSKAAGARQEALRAQTEAARADLDAGAQSGALTPEQQKATGERMQRAQQAMQRATQAMERGEQASAAEQQRQAADHLQEAEQALRRARGLHQAQKDELAKLAEEQKKLEEDILRLARDVEARKNRPATQALQQAGQSGKRAHEAMEQGEPESTDAEQQQTEEALDRAKDALEEERDRYMDLRQEELLFKIREELEQFLAKQVAITQQTMEASRELGDSARMTRPLRRRLNELAEREKELVARSTFMSEALRKEQEIVYAQVLGSIGDDLGDVARRLGGTQPDPGEYTQAVQHDVHDRLTDLIEALKREQQRRQQEQQNQQNQPQDRNRNRNGRQPLVPFRAELQMLKRLEEDIQRRLDRMQQLVKAAGADGVSETEMMLIERLGHRHAAITRTFLELKAKMEEAMSELDKEAADGEEKKDAGGRGR